MKKWMAWVIPLSLFPAACGVSPSAEEATSPSVEKGVASGTEGRADESADESAEDMGSTQQQETWSSSDNPSRFLNRLQRNLEQLPTRGEASPIPWSGSYWRMSLDSIAYRWDGPQSYSPAMKYQAAFGGNRVEDHVSAARGVDSQRNARICDQDLDCNQALTEVCGKRSGQRTGRCIPSWFGICNGWAAASILFPEPIHPVMRGGVLFKVQDIKALLSMVQTSTVAKRVSLRCEKEAKLGAITEDGFGRPVDRSCRDTNPGTFHLLLANYLGLQRRSFVEDRTFDRPIWNQPIRGYDVLVEQEVSSQEATRLVSGANASSRYRFNPSARRFVYVKNQVAYIKESTATTDGNLSANIDYYTGRDVYEYILELSAEGAVIGGEWVGPSKENHPDFLWLPLGQGAATVAGGAISYDAVRGLAASSVSPY
jgi:hypothetical protein